MKRVLTGFAALILAVSLFSAYDVQYAGKSFDELLRNNGELTLLSSVPASNTITDRRIDEVILTFSDDILPLQSVEDIKINYSVEPEVKGVFRQRGKNTIAFIPSKPLAPEKRYVLKIKKGILSLDSAVLRNDIEIVLGPVNLKAVYASNTTIHPDSSIFLIFNYAVPLDELKEGITLKEGGRDAAFEVVKSKKKKDNYYYYNNYFYTDDEDDTLNLTSVEIKPLSPLKPSAVYRLKIFLKDYMRSSEDYTIYTLGEFKYLHHENVGQIYYNSNSYINIEFTNPVKTEDVFRNVFFVSEGKSESLFDYFYSTQSQYFSAYKKLVPGGEYMIKVGENLKDVHGSTIKNPGIYRFTAGDYWPFVSFAGGYYNPTRELSLPFSLMNVSGFEMFIKEMTVSEFIKEMSGNDYGYWGNKGYRSWERKNFSFKTEKNVLYEDTLFPGKELKNDFKLGMGIVEYVMSRDTYDISFSYQVTPLRMHSIMTNKNGYILLSDRAGEMLIGGRSDVYVYNAKGSRLFSVPFSNGMLTMNTTQMKWFVSAYNQPGKLLYGENKGAGVLMPYFLEEKIRDSRAYVFTDKNLYKLADSVIVTGIVRDVEGNKVRYSKMKKINYSVYNPDYREIYKGSVSTDNNGIFSLRLMIPDSFKTGHYYVYFTDKKYFNSQAYFMVQEFKEPTFEVKTETEKTNYLLDEKTSVKTAANYLSGMKMAGDSVYSNLIINRTSFYSQDFPAFNFYISNDTSLFDGAKYDSSDTLSSAGEFRYEKNISFPKVMNPLSVQYIATVKGVDKEGISQSVYFTKQSGNAYAGLRVTRISDADDSTLVEAVVCGADGKALKGKKYKVRIIRQYSYNDSVPDTLFVKPVASGSDADSFWVKLDKRAYYNVEIEHEKAKISQGFYYGWWWYYDNERKVLSVSADKGEYQIGDTAVIKIYSPQPERKHYCYFNTDSILALNEVKFTEDTSVVRVPITKNLVNGFYFSVFALGEDSAGNLSPASLFVQVSAESKRLAFEMKTDRDVYEPNDTVRITLRTESKREATAIITVVDEAVLMLTNYSYSDPMYSFYGYYENKAAYRSSDDLSYPYYYGYRNYEMLDGMVQAAPSQAYKMAETSAMDEDKEEGLKKTKDGGEMQLPTEQMIPPSAKIRKDFKQLAFYTVKVSFSKDKDGKAKFRLPDNVGKFRISCIALTEDEFDVKTADIRVEKKLIINQSLPLFLRPFDKVDAAFVILDNTGEEGEVKTGISSKQVKFSSPQSSEAATVNSKALALFRGEAMFEDSAVFYLSAQKGDYSDYVMVSIPIINHNLYEHSALFSSSDKGVTEKINISKDIVKEKSSVTVSLNSTIIGGMELPLEYLNDYRYLCLEQKLSRAFPYIVGEEVINLYNLSSIKKDKLRKYVSGLLKDVSKCQAGNGGFKYYEDDHYESEYLSLYAMYVLHFASKAGYDIDGELLNRGTDYIDGLIRNNFNDIWSYSERAKYSLRSYAVYVMMLYGKKDYKSLIDTLYEKRDKLYLAEKARLLEVLSEYAMTREYNQLLGEIKSNAKVESAYAYFDDGVYDWCFLASDLRTTAIVLTTLLRTEKKYEYAEYVMNLFNNRMKKGMWINTHSTAMVLEAITEYYRIYEKETPLFSAFLELNGKSLASKKFSGRKDQKYSYEIKGSSLSDSLNVLELKKDGKGRMYYTLRMKYARNRVEHELFNGFEVKREYLTLKGDSVKSFRKGEVYQVKITIKTNKWRSFVVLEDNLPAGFEVVKREFATEFANLAHYNQKRWWWGEFYHEEFYRDRIVANSVYLYEGTHDYTYFVKANVSGEFNAPPANVFEMYTPEVFGYTSSEVIKIE